MDIFRIIVIALILAVISLLLKKQQPELSAVISIIGGIFISYLLLDYIEPVISEIKNLSSYASIDSDILSLILKAIAICFLASFASECCRDCGENSLAVKIDTAARIVLLCMCIPLISEIVNKFSLLAEL